uniref:Triokinase/FMN cyclase n=1 Tax=Ditylenchus dipsaci TaxID=166011 RepID=A0A915E1I5_9BILA
MASESRKKFINHPENVVTDALKGLVASDQSVCFHPHNRRIILRKDYENLKTSKVTLVCGGGSGHEPFAAGFVGQNGLSAAVCGDVFASPPSNHVSDAIRAVNSSNGTILVVINYTGDRLHFGMAVERLKASAGNNQTKLQLVYVDDDVALEGDNEGVGRRGLAGAAILLHILGVMVDQQAVDFKQALSSANKLIANLGTLGVSLYPCAIPGKAAMFQLDSQEMEFGLGIHGESGLQRCRMQTASQIVDTILHKLVNSTRLKLSKEDRLGEIIQWMLEHGHKVERLIVGTLMSSLDGHGLSVTVLKVADDDWLTCLDKDSAIFKHWKVQEGTEKTIERCLTNSCKLISDNHEELNRLDRSCGDGDCGTSLDSAAKAIQKATQNNQLDFCHPKILFLQLSQIFEEAIGGTSGALYALLLGAASKAFEESAQSKDFKEALKLGLDAVVYYGHAQPGHRTMVDPLNAAVENSSEDWDHIVQSVEQAALDTSRMQAKSGRASYTSTQHQQEIDPGAKAVALWFRAIYDEYCKSIVGTA